MAALDAESYPHLIDLIWSHADFLALLRLRTANRRWRWRAATLLSTHLVAFSTTHTGAVVHGDVVRYPGQPDPNDIKTIDVVGPYCLCNYDCPLPSLHILFAYAQPTFTRMWADCKAWIEEKAPWRGSHTVVVFTWASSPYSPPRPCGCPACKLCRCDAASLERSAGGILFDTLSTQTRKVVTNISPDWGLITGINLPHQPFIKPLDEIVLNFVTPPGHSVAWLAGSGNDIVWLFQSIAEHLAVGAALQYTFVNSEVLPLALLRRAYRGTSDWRFDFSHFTKTSAALRNPNDSFATCIKVLFEEYFALRKPNAAVECISSAEYEARVGTKRFRYETMEQP
jgi:hypothetical protein